MSGRCEHDWVMTSWPADTCSKCGATRQLMTRPELVITPAQSADDTEEIDDQVQDLLTTMLRTMALEFFGEYVDPEHAGVTKLTARFMHDLASLGIRLTYDTPIGGGK